MNPVLGTMSPGIHHSVEHLPRASRTSLAKLKTGKCHSLRLYQFFMNNTNDETCQLCHTAQHSSRHLFSCPVFPTSLSVIDLWLKLVDVAKFVSTLPCFNHLPLVLQIPLPPPEPPP
jgi:hypothetical protein